ncbi:MAG: tetratricopeptide repeat protein [Actinobacteria bacterium]|nr:tetratricopeptide repeat protein [Actinomycetota bacterium]
MLLDRRKVKFWQKIVFSFMAVLMVVFIMGYAGFSWLGCDEEQSASEQINQEVVAQESAAAAASEDPQEWVELGQLYVERGSQSPQESDAHKADLNKAAAAYTRADELLKKQGGKGVKQQRLDVLRSLVDVQLYLQDFAGATATYGIITSLTPKDPQAYFEMASIAINAGDTDTALLAFNRFLELDPDSPDAPAVKEWIEQNKPSKSSSPSE